VQEAIDFAIDFTDCPDSLAAGKRQGVLRGVPRISETADLSKLRVRELEFEDYLTGSLDVMTRWKQQG
jgi:hypothetical protein